MVLTALFSCINYRILRFPTTIGALISPTDPVAVIGFLKTVGIPKSLETRIAGESLFNDGIGVVVFLPLF